MLTRKSSRKQSRKIQNIYVILNFPALDFLIHKIKELEFQKNFCCSLPYFYTYPDRNQINRLAKDQWRRRDDIFLRKFFFLVKKKMQQFRLITSCDWKCVNVSKMEQLFIRTWQLWPHYEKQNGSIWQKSTDAKCFLAHPSLPHKIGRAKNHNLLKMTFHINICFLDLQIQLLKVHKWILYFFFNYNT